MMIGALGHAYGLAGRRDLTLKQLARLEELSSEKYVPPYYKAFIHAGLGDRAVEQLELSYANHDTILFKIKIDPLLDPLLFDPRMDDLMRRVGFDPGPVS